MHGARRRRTAVAPRDQDGIPLVHLRLPGRRGRAPGDGQADATDQVFGHHARLGLGYPLGRIGTRPDESPTTFGWVGGGGSYVYADIATSTAFALTKTRLTPHFDTAQRLADLTTAEFAGRT
ncbi:serine hydrolase [Streptomyces sp. NPDC127039]|uniref:serine hydrolase n=1 Tax=Streptomyces sp. NPDC127039 TaxID=3347115 RepID=UPI003660097C